MSPHRMVSPFVRMHCMWCCQEDHEETVEQELDSVQSVEQELVLPGPPMPLCIGWYELIRRETTKGVVENKLKVRGCTTGRPIEGRGNEKSQLKLQQ